MQPNNPQTVERVKPPWKLTGSGWVLLYRFDEDFVAPYLPGYLQGAFAGGVGAVMLVNYRTSPVGAYRELLFVPGVFKHGRRKYHAVTQIYVSTEASLVNGRENWGIPKQLADFEIEQIDDTTQQITVLQGDAPFFQAALQQGILRFPVNTLFVPGFLTPKLLQQRDDGQQLITAPRAAGVISPTATLEHTAAEPSLFPDVSAHKPLGIIEAVNVRLFFPAPKTP